MGAPAIGEVVVVPFPFSDLTQSKVRPALCLADAGRGDRILCQITSQPYGDPLAIKLEDQDFATGGLRAESYARPGKLFTADTSLILSTQDQLSSLAFQRVLATVVNLLRVGHA